MRAAIAIPGTWQWIYLSTLRRGRVFGRVLRASAASALEHDVLNVAQAAAYSAVLALFPTLIVVAAGAAMLPSLLPFRAQLGVFFARILPANVLPLLGSYFTAPHPSQTVGSLLGSLLGSLVVGLVGAGNVMATLMEGFRRAHGLPLVRGSFWRRRLRALTLVPLSLVPMAAASCLVVFGNLLAHSMARALPGSLRAPFLAMALLLRWVVALGASTVILLVIYHLGTDRTHLGTDRTAGVQEPGQSLESGESRPREPGHRPHRQGSGRLGLRLSLPGAALATLLWFLATLLFGFYVTRYADYNRVYGSLGAGIALMVWLYLIALCVLAGSEFNAQASRLEGERRLRGYRSSDTSYADSRVTPLL